MEVIERTKEQVAEEQGGFRSGRGCIDQKFVLKQLDEKYKEKRKELHVAFMDLEKCKIKFVEKNCGECCLNVELTRTWSGL